MPICHCNEFLTAIAVELQSKGLREFYQYFTKTAQASIAGGVTILVVEFFEMIDIKHQDSGGFP
ncbi:MAG: hypothetical protein RBU26_04435 [Sphaerochaeta sp.]|jgi:hypothetical protein|uniref:hypothetical protein n=1 Tax=Sphaerochaeta sp. TaxID=1972642 RepID=UPI002A35D019|nr:hypothetical protein [Sphaerochaeta sp.]MDX9824164.1 hypothetical protein [Sphaerochaeta sp.]